MQTEIYQAIHDRLCSQLPFLQYVDLQKGQFDEESAMAALPTPAALIEFKQIDWAGATAGGYYMGVAFIAIHLYQNPVNPDFNANDRKAESLMLLHRQDELFRALEKFSGNHFQPLIRTGETILSGTTFAGSCTEFKTTLYDAPADDHYVPITNYELQITN